MDNQEISAAVLVHGLEIILATEPDLLPENIAPFRIVGYFRLRRDGEAVCDTPDKQSALLMGIALPMFVAHAAKVQAGAAQGDAISWLERLHSL